MWYTVGTRREGRIKSWRQHHRQRYAATLHTIGDKIASRSDRQRTTARRYARRLRRLVSRCKSTSSRPALNACGATASRHQMTQTRPTYDTFTPAGYGSSGLFCARMRERIGRKAAAAGLSLLSWCVTCATLDNMILYNRPRTRDEVRGLRRRGLRAIIRNYDISGGCTAEAVRPLSLYADARQQGTDDEQRGGRLGRCRAQGSR